MAQKKSLKKDASNASGAGAHAVNLGDVLEIGRIATLSQSLESALDVDAKTIELNAGAVERADAASLQLLLAFRREATALGYAVRWKAPSGPLRDAARCVGMAGLLGLA